eukprot:352427-Chlamydomonas_euryale.AAC.3
MPVASKKRLLAAASRIDSNSATTSRFPILLLLLLLLILQLPVSPRGTPPPHTPRAPDAQLAKRMTRAAGGKVFCKKRPLQTMSQGEHSGGHPGREGSQPQRSLRNQEALTL